MEMESKLTGSQHKHSSDSFQHLGTFLHYTNINVDFLGFDNLTTDYIMTPSLLLLFCPEDEAPIPFSWQGFSKLLAFHIIKRNKFNLTFCSLLSRKCSLHVYMSMPQRKEDNVALCSVLTVCSTELNSTLHLQDATPTAMEGIWYTSSPNL